ncbi:hypothetical protein Naga_100099g10 [Nannochloropsis gaditana]|uniref:Uncharacterized protein n=1 Tax=Nannochloropsis gaditana TaxID=72520 RepID=W7TKA2_9STRA|nr:hypothetical protein Naga_100099g10 [Nannochloropsis gaditana]
MARLSLQVVLVVAVFPIVAPVIVYFVCIFSIGSSKMDFFIAGNLHAALSSSRHCLCTFRTLCRVTTPMPLGNFWASAMTAPVVLGGSVATASTSCQRWIQMVSQSIGRRHSNILFGSPAPRPLIPPRLKTLDIAASPSRQVPFVVRCTDIFHV